MAVLLAVWPAVALIGCTLLSGVVLGFVIHWSLELWALRPALREARQQLVGRDRSGYDPPRV